VALSTGRTAKSLLEVLVAREYGFCIGVKKAVELAQKVAEEAGESGRSVWTLGPLIHNRRVVNDLARRGIRTASGLADVPPGDILILPSHGAPPELLAEARAKGVSVRDATCPLVRKVQDAARSLCREGYTVIVVGDPSHTEVRSVVGWASGPVHVVESPEEVGDLTLEGKVAVVSQTTQRPETVRRVVERLREMAMDVRVEPTLCHVTSRRQEEMRELAQKVDVLVVVGGRQSANTKKLVDIGRESGKPVYHVESAQDIDPSWFNKGDTVGVAAGTSTPDWVTEEVVARMEEINENTEAQDKEGKAASPGAGPEEAAEPGAEPAQEAQVIPPLPKAGDTVTGTVVKVSPEEILVDIGYKTEGILPPSELGRRFVSDPSEVVKEGEVIDALIVRIDDEGRPVLSRRRVAEEQAWRRLEEAHREGLTIEAPVTSKVKGGLVADVGTRGFIPASQVGLEYIEDLSGYVGKTLKVKVIEVDRGDRRVILSEKKALEEERERQRQAVLESLEEGEIREGEVKRVTDYGAFVDIGGIDGLLHVSEMSWKRVNDPREVVKEGDRIQVCVLKVDREKERVSLGLKQVGPDPWAEAVKQFPVGSIVEGRVVSVVDFGAFVELTEGVEGLVHISQLAPRRVAHPSEVVEVGDRVRVKVLKVNPKERRISLSIREAEQEMDRRQIKKFLKEARKDSVVTIGDVVGDLLQGANLGGPEKDGEPDKD